MKKSIFTVSIIVLAFLLVFSFTFAGGGKKSKDEPVPQMEVEEVSEGADDEVDPFIVKNREWFEQYHTTGYYDWIGPNGETITGDEELVLTRAEVKKLREGNYTYALIANNMAGEYMVGLSKGLEDFFNYVGIERVAFTTAEFDPAKQKSDVETVLAKNPDLIIGHPTDPITAAESFQPAVDAGIPIAMLDQLPKGYEYGKDIIGVVTENHVELATYSAEAMNQLLGDGGKVGVVFYDDIYYVCNILDDTFAETIEEKYPQMDIVSKMGWVGENEAGNVASGMILRDPDIEGLWVTYMTPAQSVLSALKDANRTDIQVVTYGIDVPTLVNIAQDGPMTITGASPWNIGMDLAIMGSYGLLGKEVPNNYITVPGFIVTKEMVREVWENSMHYEMPDVLEEALRAAGL
jgi:ribose transport system substrate-binding protein